MRLRTIGMAAAILAFLLPAAIEAQAEMVGPWNVVPYRDAGVFKHCIMGRAETSSSPFAAITLGTDHAAIALIAKAWKLTAGQTFKAKVTAAQVTEDIDAQNVDDTTIAIVMTGHDSMMAALRRATSLTIAIPQGTFNIPYDSSAQAFAKLDQCVATETKTAAAPTPPTPAGPAPAPPRPAPPVVAGGPSQATPPRRISDAAYSIMRADCEQDQDKDRQVSGCTAVVESGREEPLVQGIAFSNRGFAYSGKNEWDRAIADFTEALRLNPQWPQARWGRGDAYYQKSNWPQAIADYNEAIRNDPKDASLLRSRGLARFRARDFGMAIDDYAAAIVLTPRDATLFSERGDVYVALGDNRRAVADYEAALKIEPTLETAIAGRDKVRGSTPTKSGSNAGSAGGIRISAMPSSVTIEQFASFMRDVAGREIKTEVDKDGNFIAYPTSSIRTMLIAKQAAGAFDEKVTTFVNALRQGCKTYGPNEVIDTTQSGAVTARRAKMQCKIDNTDMVYDDVYVADDKVFHFFVTFGTDRSRTEVSRIAGRIFGNLGRMYR